MSESKQHLYKLCIKCDYFCNILEENNYCPTCGAMLINKCRNCGNEIIYPYATYCGFCGTPYKDQKIKKGFKEI